jgi:hypothetical protein
MADDWWTQDAVVGAAPRVGYIPGIPKKPAPPSGYRETPDGNFEFVPGGPADPDTKGSGPESNQAFDNKGKLRNDFNSLQPVKTYQEYLPVLDGAIGAPDNAQGDLTGR